MLRALWRQLSEFRLVFVVSEFVEILKRTTDFSFSLARLYSAEIHGRDENEIFEISDVTSNKKEATRRAVEKCRAETAMHCRFHMRLDG